jgi:hypothetical protein
MVVIIFAISFKKEVPDESTDFLTKAAFNVLLSNLLKIEESLDEIFDEFFGKSSKETEKLKIGLSSRSRGQL